MRALLVGAGGMGRTWAKNLAEHGEVELAGWVDVIPGQVETASEMVGLSPMPFTNLNQAISDVKPDFIVDVTIPEAHEEVTLTALRNGIPIIGEKPMTVSMESAKRMVHASEASNTLYMVSQSRRYDGRQAAFKELVKKCGKLGIINADFYIGAHFGGFRDAMDHVLILDMAIHTFDQAREISGLNPVSVYAEEFNPEWSWYRHGSSANCLFDMEGGSKFNYRGSWCSEGLHSSWEGEWRVVGEHGTAKWNGHEAVHAEIVTATAGFHSEFESLSFEPFNVKAGIAGSLEDFLNALKTGQSPRGECHDNILSLAMVFGAIESAKRGCRVTIDEMLSLS